MKEYADIIVRVVKGYGFLAIVSVDGVEVYRGEFQKSAVEAFHKAIEFTDRKIVAVI